MAVGPVAKRAKFVKTGLFAVKQSCVVPGVLLSDRRRPFFRGVESYTVARLLLSTWVHCGAAGVPKPVRLHASSW